MVDVAQLGRELDRVRSASPFDAAAAVAVLQDAVAACRSDPQATAGVLIEAELLGELAEAYEQLGRTDEALAAMQDAIAAGYRSQPDPRCRVARILLRSGRAEPAHAIFAEVKADTPDDVALYNKAGLEYAAAGDHARALEWLTEGLRLALRSGDPDRLVEQLTALRRDSLAALGRNRDPLDVRAEYFLAQSSAPSVPSVPVRRGITGDVPAPGGSARVPTAAPRGKTGESERMRLALSWFPPAQFAAALAAWPQLAQEWGTDDHTEYSHRLQRHLNGLARSLGPAWIAPISLEPFRAWCARSERDPATGAARSAYAAELARTRPQDLIAWPPQRNAVCWCGSGRKYKKCCGHPAVEQGVAG